MRATQAARARQRTPAELFETFAPRLRREGGPGLSEPALLQELSVVSSHDSVHGLTLLGLQGNVNEPRLSHAGSHKYEIGV